jgi:RHS repeat-associated protein
LIQEQSEEIKHFHQDRLSTRLITDASGNVVGTMDHLPFGEDASVVGESEKHRFTTYERDGESGTDYAINRQYAINTGRFMQPDPIAGKINVPQSFNRYTYTINDPVNYLDPLGLLRICFWHFKDVSNGDGPPRWVLSDVDCIDLPDIAIEGNPNAGGGNPEKPQNPQKQQRCADIAKLPSANTDVGLLARLIFAEATGSEGFGGSGQDYVNERYAIAATVYNRVAFLKLPGPTLGIGMRNSSVSDVIGSRGAATLQYAGFQYNSKTGQVDISAGIQRRINQALNSGIGSNDCNDLLFAIYVANEFAAGRGLDPFGTGMSFGFMTAGSIGPGSAFPRLPLIPGSGNIFYGPPRR